MRTSVDLPDDLLKRAKRAALERNSTLRELMTRGLERELDHLAAPPGTRARFPLLHVREDCPAVRLSIEQIKELEAQQEAESHRDLLARRQRPVRPNHR